MDRYQQKLSAFTNVSTAFNLAATATGTKKLISAITGYIIYVQKISVSVFTSAAQSLTFQDNAGTPVVVGFMPNSQTAPFLIDFGPEGYPLTESKELDMVISAAGVGAAIQITAYARATGVANVLIGNQVGGGTPGTGGSLDP